MATSSITKNFVISGSEQVERFVEALEASANEKIVHSPVEVTYLEGARAITKFMERRKKADAVSE